MEYHELIGTWRRKEDGSVITLRMDGMAVLSSGEHAEWRYVDECCWQLRISIPENPVVPGLEEGAVEEVDYEIIEFIGDAMTVRGFDQEPQSYERISTDGEV